MGKREQILEEIETQELDEVVLLDDLDEAILGLVQLQVNGPTVVAYSTQKILELLVQRGMEWDEAIEYFDFNIKCLYVGPGSPVLVQDTWLDC